MNKTPQSNADLITEELFREAYQYEDVREPSLKTVIAKSLKCTKKTVYNFFPIAKWLPEYKLKESILGDLVAGVTVAVMHIPHGLAYAPLGRVEPVVGFYMAVFPVLFYTILGTSRHISIGTFAVVCAMTGQVVMKYEPPKNETMETNSTNVTYLDSMPFLANSVNGTNVTHPENGTYFENGEVAAALCLLVGLWQAGLGLLRMGSLTVIMSETLVSGFTTAAAVHVLSYQLKNLFGVKIPPFSGIFKLIRIYISFFSKISTVNLVTLSMSIFCIFILLLFNEFIKPLIQKKFPKNKIPVPIELIVIVLGILISYFAKLEENCNVSVVGNIPKGLPLPLVPPPSIIPSLILDSLIIAFVALAVNLSLAKIFAKKGFYTVSDNQEFVAYGMANIFGSFFRCLPSAASLSRSTIQFAVGGKTQLASIFSIVLVIFILLCAGPLFEPVPYCVLSSIVAVTLKGLLMQMCDVCGIWRQSHWDGFVWLGTFFSAVILDLDYGLGIGVALSLISVVWKSYSIQESVLGRVPKTNIYLDMDHFKSAKPVPNVYILQIRGNMNFCNSSKIENLVTNHFNRFLNTVGTSNQLYFVLDMSAVTQIDPTAIESLRHIYKYLSKSNCDLYLTDCNLNVYRTFEVCNLYKVVQKDRILASVADAVEYLTSNSKNR